MNHEAVKDSLFKMPRTTVTLEARDGKAVLTNTGKLPAVAVSVARPGHADTFHAGANFFWLDAGESKTVDVTDTSGLKLEGWNIGKPEESLK
jgi:hypothetical protein